RPFSRLYRFSGLFDLDASFRPNGPAAGGTVALPNSPAARGRKPFASAWSQEGRAREEGVVMATVVGPETRGLVEVFVKARQAFGGAFCQALQYAKEAGEALLKLQTQTGLKGATLFAEVRKQAQISFSDRSGWLYLRIASRWNQLQVVAGEALNEASLNQAIKLLQQTKTGKTSPKKGKGKPDQAAGKGGGGPADASQLYLNLPGGAGEGQPAQGQAGDRPAPETTAAPGSGSAVSGQPPLAEARPA